MPPVLADTSGLYALLNRRDPYHAAARQYYQSLRRGVELVIVEYVLVETMTLLRARGHSPTAVQFRNALTQSKIFSLRHSTPKLELAAFDIYQRYDDKAWSYTDCAIMATAEALDTTLVFSFDRHIDQMGLTRLPNLA